MADPYQKIKDDCAAWTGDRMLGVGFFQPKSGAMTPGAGLDGGGSLLFRFFRRRENARQGLPPMTLLGVSQRAVYIYQLAANAKESGARQVVSLLSRTS
jgi:hypothetical protein